MTEKVNKIKLPKYSSYLTDTDSELLDLFCTQFDCSKAKALPLLLKFWNDNKDKVSNELVTISYEDISAKKYDERLANIENKLATISYDTELVTIKEKLATLENKLATIEDKGLNSDSEPEPEQIKEDSPPNKPELPPESPKKENTPKKGNKRKGGNYDKVMQYINSLPNGATVKNVTTLAKDIGVDSSFFSPSKNSGIKIWEQYFIACKDDNGEDCYILNKPE